MDVGDHMKWLKDAKSIVPGSWAIVYFESVSNPVSDRYEPSDNIPVHKVYITFDKAVWEREIIALETQKANGTVRPYVAFHVDKVALTEISIKISA